MKQDGLRRAISAFLGFLLTLVTFLGMNLLWTNLTVLSSSYLVNHLKTNDVSQSIYDNLEQVYSSLSMPSGVPTEVFTSCINTGMIAQAQAESIHQAFIGVVYDEVAPNGLHDTFIKAFTAYANESGMALTPEVVSSIEGLADVSVEEYVKNVKFPLIDRAAAYFPPIVKAFRIVCLAGAAVFAAICAFLLALYRRKRLAMNYIAASFLGASLLGLVFSAVMLAAKPFAKLAISPQAYYDAITGYLHTSMWIYFGINLALMLTGAAIILVVRRIGIRHKKAYAQEVRRQKAKKDQTLADEFFRKPDSDPTEK